MPEWNKALSALSSTTSWNDPMTCECVQGPTSPPPFQNPPFFVEPVGDKARLYAAERWLHVSDPRGSPEAGITERSSTAGAIRARLGRSAPFDRSRSNHLRILSNKTRTTLVLAVNKRSRQILHESMNIAARE